MNYNKLFKNITKKEAEQALCAIHEIQEIDSKYSKAYFWSPASIASQRRAREFTKEIGFSLNGKEFTYHCAYSESCHHCYFSKKVFFNGEPITMRTINTLEQKLNEME